MDLLLAIVIAPAIAALVFAIAFGASNPIRWAAWGAILGPVVAILLLMANGNTQPVASYGHDPEVTHTYRPTNEMPAQAAPITPYKVPESEQYHAARNGAY